MTDLSKWGGLVSILLLTAGVGGCGGNALKTYPVEGNVTILDGSPLTVGEVVFSSDKVTARGQINENGSFVLSTDNEGSGDGAPVGVYKVAILGAAVSKKDPANPYAIEELIDRKYADQTTSDLEFTVEAGPNSFGIIVEKPAE
jgi:hypothetical protein